MTVDTAILPVEPLGEARAAQKKWGLAARIGFRFAFCYWLLYCLPSIAYVLPGGQYLNWPLDWLWHGITPWTARHLLHLGNVPVAYVPTGSGDTAFDFIQNFLFLAISAVATILWSLLDRKRGEYGKCYAWLRVLVRFTLAFTLLIYGLIKIFPTQFQPPSLVQLTETYGESSPMGLLWTFMGASMPYTIFGGLAEATAGTLLLFRRTTLVGSFLATGVLLNVVMLNFCYDVPVKLYSANLLLMALFLLLPDISRLANLFLFNRTVAPVNLSRPLISRRWMRIAGSATMTLLVIYFVTSTAWRDWNSLQQSRFSGDPPIYGIYDVDSLQLNGRAAAANNPVNPGWIQVIAERGFWMTKDAHGDRTFFGPHFSKSKVALYCYKTRSTLNLTYVQPTTRSLVFSGYTQGERLELHLHKLDTGNFLLTHRGFHWISEYPFNR